MQHSYDTSRLAVLLAVALLAGGAALAGDAPADRGRSSVVSVARTARDAGARPAGIVSAGRGARRVELPVVENPGGADDATGRAVTAAVRISAATMAGRVNSFALSPDGSTAVYIADQEVVGRYELYSVPVAGGAAPVKLNAGLTFGTGDNGVSAFEFSPDGSRVLFLADPTAGSGADDLYSAPTGGGANAVRLNPTAATPVTAFGTTPNGATALFFARTAAGAAQELYAVSVTGGSARQLSAAGAGNPAGGVSFALPSPDSSRIVYSADATGIDQWYSVATAAATSGTSVALSAALGTIGPAAIAPDSATVVYAADDQTINRVDIFAIPVAGGARIKLNPSMAGSAVTRLAISGDGRRVAYLADQDTAGVIEVYGARIDTAGSGTRINTPMSGTQLADTLAVAPDDMTAVFEADQDTPGTVELFRAPLDASAAPAMLHDLSVPFNVGFFFGVGTPIIGNRAVYPVVGTTVNLYSVPYDGSAPFARINDAIPVGDAVLNAFLPTGATRLMAYGEGDEFGIVTERLYVAAIRDDLPIQQVDGGVVANDLGVFGYEIAAGEDVVVYLQDELTPGKTELFARALDSDGDGLDNSADNCPFVANAGQGAIPFGQTVLATDSNTFAWPNATEVRYARGPLASVSTMGTNLTGTLVDARRLVDATSPVGGGAGFFYLFAVDCAGRSYQTSPGAEPGRDAALP